MHFDFEDAYGHLDSLLAELQLAHSAAYLHGSLSGLLTSGAQFHGAYWLELALSEADLCAQLPEEAVEQLSQLADHTRLQMHQHELGIAPMLPSDEDDLRLRVAALHDWCGGFLGGLGLSGKIKKNAELSPELKEALRDIEKIARSEIELDENDPESDENALMELFEYVRVCAAMSFQELSARTQNAPSTSDRQH